MEEILKQILNQLPFLIMSMSNGNYYLILIVLLPLIINYLSTFKFKVFNKIPKDYKNVEISKTTSHNFNSFFSLGVIFNNYFEEQITNSLIKDVTKEYIPKYKFDKYSGILFPKNNSFITIKFTDENISDLKEKGFKNLNINWDELKKYNIYFEVYDKKIQTESDEITISKEILTINISAKTNKILNDFMVILYNHIYIENILKNEFIPKNIILNHNEKILYLNINIKKTFNNIFLSEENETKLLNVLNEWKDNIEENKKLGIPPKLGLMFCGVPGCGKSSCIYAISNYLEKDIFNINLKELTNKELKDGLYRVTNKIIVIEELDCYDFTHNRDNKDKKELENKDLVNLPTMLEILDGYNYIENCVFIVTSNHPEKIDDAIKRPGRIDHIIEFDLCDEHQFKNIFKHFTKFDYKEIDPNFKFQNKIFSSSFIINSVILPNRNCPEKILELL